MTLQARQPRFSTMNVGEIHPDEGNVLLEAWDHPLGPCNRPFGQQAWVLDIFGAPVAVAMAASPVSKTVAGYGRAQVVELARIVRHPDHPHVLRVMLRLWRAYLAHEWPYNPVAAAVAYAMPGTPGDIYRFDGWERVGKCRVSRGGGTWTNENPKVSQIEDGVKTLWRYVYEKDAA